MSSATATTDNASAATPTPIPALAPVLSPLDVSPKKNGDVEPVANGGRTPVAVKNGGISVKGLTADIDDDVRIDEVTNVVDDVLGDVNAAIEDAVGEVMAAASVAIVFVSTGVAVTEIGIASLLCAVVVTAVVSVTSDMVKRLT
jgi:hypothetical protein